MLKVSCELMPVLSWCSCSCIGRRLASCRHFPKLKGSTLNNRRDQKSDIDQEARHAMAPNLTWSPSGFWKLAQSNPFPQGDSDIYFLQNLHAHLSSDFFLILSFVDWIEAVNVGYDREKLLLRIVKRQVDLCPKTTGLPELSQCVL